MAYRPKQVGTTLDHFELGLPVAVTLDASAITTPYSFTFPPDAGALGDALTTDGTGVLSWSPVGAAADSTVPYFIPIGETYTVYPNKQALFAMDIDVEGTLNVAGILIVVT